MLSGALIAGGPIHQKADAKKSDKHNIFIRMLNEPFLMINAQCAMVANDCGDVN